MPTDTVAAEGPPTNAPKVLDAPPALAGRALHDLWTVFRYEVRSLALSVRTWIPMAIYAGFGALSMYLYVKASDAAHERAVAIAGDKANELIEKNAEEAVGAMLTFVGWGSSANAAEIFRDKVPLIVVYFFALASYFLPLLVALVTFDQFSELSTRGARFALLRVRRGTYFAGKVLAAITSVAAFLAIMWLVVAGFSCFHDGNDAVPYALRESLRAWALMCVLALPYLSLTALISSLARPGFAFLLTLGAWVAMWIGSAIVKSLLPWAFNRAGWTSVADAEQHLTAVFPWYHAPKLISRDLTTVFEGLGSLVLLAAIGYALTLYVIRRRDV